MERARFLVLPLGLLVVAAGLIAWASTLSAAQADCQPVENVELTYAPPEVHPDTHVLLSAQILTGSLPVTYTWDFGDGSSVVTATTATALFTISHSYSEMGVYTVSLSTWNSCTVTPLVTTMRITVEARPCLTLTDLALVYTPTEVYAHQEVLFAGEILTGSPPLTYTWDFGEGALPVTGTSAAPFFTTTHVFSVAQVYTVALAAWNACTITPARRSVTLPVAPCNLIDDLAIDYWPPAARPGEVITFSAIVTGGSVPWTFNWDFGDGKAGMGRVVTHAYPTTPVPMIYTVALTAANPCDLRTTSTAVQVAIPRHSFFVPISFRGFKPIVSAAGLGYGANVAAADHVPYLLELGFDWAKGWESWDAAETTYDWVNVDNQLRQFLPYVPTVLIRISGERAPASTGDRASFRSFAQALADHVSQNWRSQGLEAVAYEIWNEPNLDYEWGGTPSAALYTALLREAYLGIKAGDPHALVVSAGLATTGGRLTDSPAQQAEVLAQARQLYNTAQVVPDLIFLRDMYRSGAKGYLDAVGTHPYGGPDAPGTLPSAASGPIYFRRAEEQHQIMLENGDASPMWATEFGWVLETTCDLGEHEWMEVDGAQQAQYLVDAYAYAHANWPWMGPMFLFNLDFATVPWYAECDPMCWYSITYRDDPHVIGSPILKRQAFYGLRDMPKHSAW
jgi:PKD repeat protein